ncbi:MAG: hypothetical protein ACRCTR_03835 [Actinomycetota bacterium]
MANPFGPRFVEVQLLTAMPVLAAVVALWAVPDRAAGHLALGWAKPGHRVLHVVFVAFICGLGCFPVALTHGFNQLVVTVTLLLGVGLVGARFGGLITGWLLQVLVLFPHLMRAVSFSFEPQKWAVLSGAHPDLWLPISVVVFGTGFWLTWKTPVRPD